MLYQFVIIPLLAVFLLAVGLATVLMARRVRSPSSADKPWKRHGVFAGWVGVVVGAWLLVTTAYNVYQFSAVKPEQVEELVRKDMRESKGVEPKNLHLTPDGWGRYCGEAEIEGEKVGVTAELVVDGSQVRVSWSLTPAES